MARAVAGSITIGAKLDTSKLEKDLENLEGKLYKQTKDLEITNVDYEAEKNKLEEINNELERQKKHQEEIRSKIEKQKQIMAENSRQEDGVTKIPKENLETYNKAKDELFSLYGQLQQTYEPVHNLQEEWDKQNVVVEKLGKKIEKQLYDIGLTEQQVQQVKNKILQIQSASNKIDIKKYLPTFKGMEKNLNKITRKISKIGLTMLGVRSIYGMITSAISRIKEDNKDFARFMQTITNMFDIIAGQLIAQILPTAKELLPTIIEIANIILNLTMSIIKVLLPVIKFIVNAIKVLVDIVGGLLGDLFGIDISTNNFANGLEKANKNASKLRKQLMGFDEMNILNKDGTTGAISGYSYGEVFGNNDYGIYNDMSDLNKDLADLGYVAVYTGEDLKKTRLELEKIIQDAIYNHRISEKNGIVTIITDLGQEIHFTKTEYDKLVDDISHQRVTSRNLDLWWAVKDTLENIDVKSFQEYIKSTKKGLKDTLYGWNVGVFNKYMDKTMKIAKNGAKELSKEIEIVKNNFTKNMDGATYEFENGVYKITMTNGEVVELTEEQWAELQPYMKYVGLDIVKNANDTGGKIQSKSGETKNKVINDAKETKNMILGISDDLQKALQSDVERAKQNFAKNMEGATYTYKDGMYEIRMANGQTTKLNEEQWQSLQSYLKANNLKIVEDNKNTNKNLQQNSKESVKGIEDEYDNLPGWLKNNVVVELLKEFGILGKDSGQIFGKNLKDVINKVLDKIETTLNNMFSDAVNMYKKFGINVPVPKIKLPRLAKGGIINQAGRGVYVGGAIAGERGREAVIPLTDSQQMALLGQEIGKNVIINFTGVLDVDGRQLAVTTAKVMNNMEFASNGGVL